MLCQVYIYLCFSLLLSEIMDIIKFSGGELGQRILVSWNKVGYNVYVCLLGVERFCVEFFVFGV